MPTPNITKTLTLKPKYEKGKVTSFNLKPIRNRIEQVIGKFDVRHTNIDITVTTKQTDAITFDTRIIVQGPPDRKSVV